VINGVFKSIPAAALPPMPPKPPSKNRTLRFPKFRPRPPPFDNSKRKAEERSAKNIMIFFGVISLLVLLVNSWIWLVKPAMPPPPPPLATVAPPVRPPAPPPLLDPVPAIAIPERPPLTATAAEITFADIRPLFEKYCFACHGAEANRNKGGLSLATLASAMAGGRSRLPGIAPGNAAGSEIIHRISLAPGDRAIMPQRGRAAPTNEEIQMITDWVNAGAPDGPT
jgi:cytochrome c5